MVNSIEKRTADASERVGLHSSARIGPTDGLSSAPSVSVSEAVRRLKAEIIAPDWRLSSNRIKALESSLEVFKGIFPERSKAISVIVMAENVLLYLHHHQMYDSYECVAFFKEAMAHVVGLYEMTELDNDEDVRVFKVAYRRFQEMKKKLRGQVKTSTGTKVVPGKPAGNDDSPVDIESDLDSQAVKQADEAASTPEDNHEIFIEQMDGEGLRQTVERLSCDVRTLLAKVEEQGVALARIIELLER